VYSNNQEYEMFRLTDPLQSVPNETRMIVRLGRALMPGEYRIKLFLLRINEVEVCPGWVWSEEEVDEAVLFHSCHMTWRVTMSEFVLT